jgi:hypothetical protein
MWNFSKVLGSRPFSYMVYFRSVTDMAIRLSYIQNEVGASRIVSINPNSLDVLFESWL